MDGKGNVWVANYNGGAPPGQVSKFSPDGTALSPPDGFRGGGLLGSIGIAVDANGNVWVGNWDQGGGKTGVSELTAAGTALSPAHGYQGFQPACNGQPGSLCGADRIAVTPAGNIWVASSGNSSLLEFSPDGTPLFAAPPGSGGLAFPSNVAIDATGNVWVSSSDRISEFASDGTAISPSSGYDGGGQVSENGLASGPGGNVWIANYGLVLYPAGLVELVGGNTPPASCPALPLPTDTGCPLSPTGGWSGGGLVAPGNVAVDGAGHIWADNFHSASLVEFAPSGTPLSGPNGYLGVGLSFPEGLAVDASGNIWVANMNNNSLTEFIGIAAPVQTPLIGPASPP